jgi:hypothetical protein
MKLTTIDNAPYVNLNSLIHIVNTGDTTQSPDGSSYKAPLSDLSSLFGGSGDSYWSASTGPNAIVLVNSGSLASGPNAVAEGVNTTAGAYAAKASGYNSKALGVTSFVHSTNSTVNSGANRSVILGGQSITATNADTVYVPNLNINTAPANDNALTQVLVRATDGTVKYRSYDSFKQLTWVVRTNADSQLYNIPGVNYGIVNQYSNTSYSEYKLPATCSVGDIIEIIEDKPGSSKTRVRANTGQTIRVSSYGTTTSGGYFETVNSKNVSIILKCIIPNQKWAVTSYFSDYDNGNISIPTIN